MSTQEDFIGFALRGSAAQRAADAVIGEARKRSGLKAVRGRNALFVSECRGYARQFAREQGQVSIEDVRRWAEARGLAPSHPNGWGAVFKTPEWRVVGFELSSIPSAHRRRVLIWALKTGA